MVPLEKGIIFYDMPPSTKTVLPSEPKKRKGDDMVVDEPKRKKSKLPVDEYSSSADGKPGAKVPWSNETITDVCRCDKCDFISIEMSDLKEHKKEMHAAKDKPPTLAPCEYDPPADPNVQFKCTLCGYSDELLRRIRQHINVKHDGKLLSCERVTHKRVDKKFSLVVESVWVYNKKSSHE